MRCSVIIIIIIINPKASKMLISSTLHVYVNACTSILYKSIKWDGDVICKWNNVN